MNISSADFLKIAESSVDKIYAQRLDQKIYSDVIDGQGHQYIDLVLEGGGVLGIALAGYIYILEKAGLRFSSIAGTSAGAIAAVMLGAIDVPSQPKGERLIKILANIPMESFMDGKNPKDRDGKKFIQSLNKGWFSKIFHGAQIIDNLFKINGINRGDAFHDWLKQELAALNIHTLADLKHRMQTTPSGWQLRQDTAYAASQLENAASLKPLSQIENYLHLVTADISTETKVHFPEMSALYWSHPDTINPADFVRCSMSIPVVFQPYQGHYRPLNKDIQALWKNLAGIDSGDSDQNTKLPKHPLFVDGGIMSNFPIDAFHKHYKVPSRPTFGVKLQIDQRSHDIEGLLPTILQIFNSAKNCRDYDFIHRNQDFKQLVAHIDTGSHHWLNFNMKKEEMLDLFFKGADCATNFLENFKWNDYKNLRNQIKDAYPAPTASDANARQDQANAKAHVPAALKAHA